MEQVRQLLSLIVALIPSIHFLLMYYLFKTFGNGLANGEDVNGHGTHVAGIIASSDEQFTGVAPNANIIALKSLTLKEIM